jgi:hypothetical protein
MAYEESLRSVSLDADSSIAIYTGISGQPGAASPNSGKQFHFVKHTGAHQVGLAVAAANEIAAGVLQNKPQVVGEAATVAYSGISMVEAGGTVVAATGAKVDDTGRAVTWVAGTDDPDLRVGTFIGSAAVGELVPVQIRL